MSLGFLNGASRIVGAIHSVSGTSITARMPSAAAGDLCWVTTRRESKIPAQVIGFNGNSFNLAPFEDADGIEPGARVETMGNGMRLPLSSSMLGCIIDPLGHPLDGYQLNGTVGFEQCSRSNSVFRSPPPATQRPIIRTPLATGIRSIDALCTIGHGQRIGIFSSAGIGKSTLLGMMTRGCDADIIVVAMVGERGREVKEFCEDVLGVEGMARSVIVVATSDQSSIVRQTAPFTATTIAEFFRDQGKRVLLIVDSLTRTARAIRETSLAAGDLPVRHGYTNSVYTLLPRLVERAGTSQDGSITGIYTVLTGEDEDIDPLADEVKSLLDGHLVLSKDLANRGVRPAIDVTRSISRLFTRFHEEHYLERSSVIRAALTRLQHDRDVILLGGTPDTELSRIIALEDNLLGLLKQKLHERYGLDDARNAVEMLWQELTQTSAR